MWVKICGITRFKDALFASDMGADALGFVCTPSPRRINPEDVVKWIHRLDGIEKVGVFTTEHASEIVGIGAYLGLDTIQIHSPLRPEHQDLLNRFKIIYALHDYNLRGLPDIECRILVDPSLGTGRKLPWRRIDVPYILSGGLTPDNVRTAIDAARPAGVDVSSGVEIGPGIKDRHLMERFIKEAKR